MTDWLLVLGLVGVLAIGQSWHCIAMCGPLVFYATHRQSGHPSWSGLMAYHGGRIAAYLALTAFGILVGQLVLPWRTLQHHQWVLGLVLMAWLILQWALPAQGKSQQSFLWKQLYPLVKSIQNQSRQFLQSAPLFAKGLMGFSHGWIPCGLLYQVLVFAWVGLSPAKAFAVMLYFGLMTSGLLCIGQSLIVKLPWKITPSRMRHLHWAALLILCLRMIALPLYQQWDNPSHEAPVPLCHGAAVASK